MVAALATVSAAQIDFAREVRPILERACYECHGPERQKKGLRLDLRATALAGGRSGPVFVAGDSAKSLAIQHIEARDGKKAMPPKSAKNGPLRPAEVELLKRWIDSGLTWPDDGSRAKKHWAYEPPVRHQPAAAATDSWSRNDLDRFVRAGLEANRLSPSPEADRRTLLRRLALDLTGLPPAPEEVEAFVHDQTPDAYAAAVDRLLASPHYGERWARLWLDLARYADTKGYEKDGARSIWKFRDYVIESFTSDKPFDRFTVEQIAGDLLPDASVTTRIATAFHRNTMTNDEGGTDDEEFRTAAVIDRVSTTAQVWLGTTLGCAQCHDHKYDPFTQREYYRVFAFLNNTADHDQEDERPVLELPTPEQTAQRARFDAVVRGLEGALANPAPELAGLDPQQAPEFKAVRDAIAQAGRQKAQIPVATVPVLEELRGERRRKTHVLEKGSFLAPGEEVTPGTPAVLHPWPEGQPKDRLGFAHWLVAADNPLTARVAVNRLWEQLFGTGLVESVEDFGAMGEAPSHPQLLDWLACEFVANGWRTKQLLRTIVTSATYRQSSVTREAAAAIDPRNRLLWRGPRLRLDAEVVRDQALAVSGLLSRKLHGPSVMPPQPDGLWNVPYNQLTWKTSDGEDRHRRALYTFWRRSTPYPSLVTFDAPDRAVCSVRRVRTNTPLQALVLLNDPVYVEAAQALAARMLADAPPTTAGRIERGFLLCLGRPPRSEELARLVRLVETEQAPWPEVASLLLNLDEMVTKP